MVEFPNDLILSPIGVNYTASSSQLQTILEQDSDNEALINSIILQNDSLHTSHLSLITDISDRLTGVLDCVIPSDFLHDLQKELACLLNAMINALPLSDIYVKIQEIYDALGTDISSLLNDLLSSINDAISSVLDKIGSFGLLQALNDAVTTLLGTLSGFVNCITDALFTDSSLDIGDVLGYISGDKQALFNSVKYGVQSGSSNADILSAGTEVIRSQLDIDNNLLSIISSLKCT